MRASFVSAAFLALASSVFAQTAGFDVITNPTQDENFKTGQTLDITWEPGSVKGAVTIILLQGATPQTLQLGPTVAASISNQAGKFAWSIPASVGDFKTYGFKIQLDSDPNTFQYSFPFHIVSGGSSTTTTTSAVHQSSTTSAITSSSSSASTTPVQSASTRTVTLSHGTGYTTTDMVVVTTTAPCTSSSHFYNSTVTSASFTPVSSAGSNVTLSTTLVLTKTPVGFPSSSPAATTTPGGVPSQVPSSATANIARGGMAVLGGLAIALFM